MLGSSRWLLGGVVGALMLMAAPAAHGNSSALEAMRMARRFGVGVSAGGPLAVLGLEADVNLSETISLGGGIGTGLDYSTFMFKLRYFLLGETASPYLGVAVARWWTEGTQATQVGPGILANNFLGAGYDYTQGFSVFLLSPAIGVQFMHRMGFAINAELQYIFRLFDFSNGTYAGLSAHWYF